MKMREVAVFEADPNLNMSTNQPSSTQTSPPPAPGSPAAMQQTNMPTGQPTQDPAKAEAERKKAVAAQRRQIEDQIKQIDMQKKTLQQQLLTLK